MTESIPFLALAIAGWSIVITGTLAVVMLCIYLVTLLVYHLLRYASFWNAFVRFWLDGAMRRRYLAEEAKREERRRRVAADAEQVEKEVV